MLHHTLLELYLADHLDTLPHPGQLTTTTTTTTTAAPADSSGSGGCGTRSADRQAPPADRELSPAEAADIRVRVLLCSHGLHLELMMMMMMMVGSPNFLATLQASLFVILYSLLFVVSLVASSRSLRCRTVVPRRWRCFALDGQITWTSPSVCVCMSCNVLYALETQHSTASLRQQRQMLIVYACARHAVRLVAHNPPPATCCIPHTHGWC
jgi:hypothetical protein